MAQSRSSGDFLSSIRWQSLRDRASKALSGLEGGARDVGGSAEKRARQAIKDLRAAADGLEKRFDIGGAGTRSKAAKKAAKTRKASTAKRSTAAKKGAKKRTSAKKRS
jgi:hypothetical protein